MVSTFFKWFGLLILAVALLWVIGVAVLGHAGLLALLFGEPDRPRIDFATLQKTDRPNQYLVCPRDLCAATPDRDAPVYAVPASDLRDALLAAVAGEPRVRLLVADAEAGYYEFEQTSRFLGFPDTITVQVFGRDNDTSTLAIYSRAHYGYRDFDINKTRIDAWLAKLKLPEAS
ncbi:MAG: DUF1499 domain-containing protein [Alphaproteobacteria bacterium]